MSARDENASALRVRFLSRILAARPESVLDVGSGLGQVLAGLRAAGIPAEGLEARAELVTALRVQGFRVHEGTAEALPLADGAVDRVSIRHVLHHVEDPTAALREALRVARSGVVVAEPWRDPDLPGQELGLLLDRWIVRQDHRLGRIHDEAHAPAWIVAQLLALGARDVEVELHQRVGTAPLAEFESDLDGRLAGLDDDHAERRALEALAEAASASGGVGLIGSAIVVARCGDPAG